MNTQTHVIMGAVLFGKPMPRLAWAAVAGAVAPDLPMYVIIAALRLQGYGLDTIFAEIYWQDWWQIANAIGHNLPLWGALSALAAAVLIAQGSRALPAATSPWASLKSAFSEGGVWALVLAFAASAFISSITDLPLHRDDGHMHFWPFTEWRFRSPVSYWDPNHYGVAFSLFEATLGVALAVILFRRYRNTGLRIILLLLLIAYVAVPAFYFWSIGGHESHQRSEQLEEPDRALPVANTGDRVNARYRLAIMRD